MVPLCCYLFLAR
uniref:Uncharacterized protein n=1 Tax=Arundo donax TaxID=35708 RepID=A0A0A9H351_ARUDO